MNERIRLQEQLRSRGIQLDMHTGNWRTLSGSFEQALASAVKHGGEFIETSRSVSGAELSAGLRLELRAGMEVQLRVRPAGPKMSSP